MKALFHNAYDVLCRDGKWIPIRFSEAQLDSLDRIHEQYGRLGRCTAGIILTLRTSAPEISFSYSLDNIYSNEGGFDIYENGVLVENRLLASKEYSDVFTYAKKSAGETLIEISLPHHARCTLWNLELGAYQTVEPAPGPFFLFYGDSLTHSGHTFTPSINFARLYAALAGGRYLNRGVGSLYFDKSVLDAGDDCRPDAVFVMLGANDIVMRDEQNNVVIKDGAAQYYPLEKLPFLIKRAEAYFDRIIQLYPDAKVVGITQPWNALPYDAHVTALREGLREGTEALCSRRGIVCIDGRTLFPHLPECLVADKIHHSALGSTLLAQSLYLQTRSLLSSQHIKFT